MKRCSKCSIDKPLSEFYKCSAAPDRLGRKCKSCKDAEHLKWYRENTERARFLARRSRLKNIEKVNARQKALYRIKRVDKLAYAAKRGRALKSAAYEAYGGYVCACCGETEPAFLSLDHINNDGYAHRRATLGKNYGACGLYMWLKKNNYPPLFQVLCMNCNYGKRMNGGVCPHQQQREMRTSA